MQPIKFIVRSSALIVCLAVFCTGTAIAQEAYVYDFIPTEGVYAYDASSTGKLALIEGSPFKTAGTGGTQNDPAGAMVGTNGSYFVTADSTTLYAYKVESNGAIGKLVSQIDTQKYSGSECGAIDTNAAASGGVAAQFNHAGDDLYVHLYGAQGPYYEGACDGIQTYGVAKNGTLTFKGVTEVNQDSSFLFTALLPTMIGDGKFGYGYERNLENGDLCDGTTYNLFAAETGGTLSYVSNSYQLPPAPPSGFTWEPGPLTDDPTNHLAIAMGSTSDPDCEDYPITFGPIQLGSYTVDSQGNLTTTNTYETMPSLPPGDGTNLMKMDPNGKVLAVATGTGVEFFHFNGADPITPFTGVLGGTSGNITNMAWDEDGHLYAQNGKSGDLYIYVVGATTVKELSPVSIPYSSPNSSIIVRTK